VDVVVAALFDHDETGGDDFEDEAALGERAGGAPDEELVGFGEDAQVDAGTFDGGGEAGEGFGFEGEAAVEEDGAGGFFGSEVGERDGGGEAFFAAEAGPEGGVEKADEGGYGDLGKVGVDLGGDAADYGEFVRHW
jgi:hypothetical protein